MLTDMTPIFVLRQITLALCVISATSLLVATFFPGPFVYWVFGLSTAFCIVIGLGSLLLIAYGTVRKYDIGPVFWNALGLFGATLVGVVCAIIRSVSM